MKFRMKAVLSMLVVVVVLVLLVSCGISQEQYNTVVTERETAKAELRAVQTELEKVKAEAQLAQNELEAVKTELQSITDELSIYKSKVQEQEEAMATARTFVEVISSLFVPAMKGEVTTETEMARLGISWLASIQNLEDEEANRLFEECIDSNFADQETLEFFLYIFETLPKILD